MAQPPEAAPLRLQSSLDSAPVQPRVQPNLDALIVRVEQQEQRQQQQRHHHHQEPQQQLQQAQNQEKAQSPGLPHTNNTTPTIGSGTHSTEPERGHSPSTGDAKTRVEAILSADTGVNSYASAAAPAAHGAHDTQSDTQHNGGAPGPGLPDMSNTHQASGPARHPVTYASPASYPPAGMPPVSPYLYSTQSIPSDPYRPNPTTLPSMRTLDHRQPQTQPQQGIPLSAHMAGPVTPAPAPAHMAAYYGVHPQSHMYGLPDPNAMRFALAPGLGHDPRIALSGGRHKKEIKRRTKTGCLTCRKRRIKCDEGKPTCNNCKKSKRECMGYDPIFKQQHGPAAIQPAPSTQTPPAVSTTAVQAPTLPSSAPHPYQPTYSPSVPSTIAHDSSAIPSTAPYSVKPEPGYEYSTAIDPALQGTDAAGTRAPRYQQSNAAPSARSGPGIGDTNPLRGMKMRVDELIALGGVPPQPPATPPSVEMLDEITELYYDIYVPGLTLFFETCWYDFAKNPAMTANPSAVLLNNQPIVSLFASFIQSISDVKRADPADMVQSGHLESSLIWTLARLPHSIRLPQRQQYPDMIPGEFDHWEARGRVQVLEALLTGETILGNPLSPPPTGNNIHLLRRNEFEFWYQLANYLLQNHASSLPEDVLTRERYLNAMRSLLDGRENRDVLYSIAVLREYTAQWDAAYNEQNVPSHLEESDPRCKLAVATRFIRDESHSAGGTTNVVRRMAELAYRAFVRPGANVNRDRRRS
ncbi:hypothetical protein N657DRAFT_577165 [Parathielavia appendiculata]|uniref:Zn(2)-C6 fungal-type domain-containing protein n=1 Tax=Parathielavia appendiculata TaxID=2587402 RepID=A0AAN6TVU8_9PEZI|nr:hypothetical protein N657DRAFT_577165 [Parathielavia appendiculata]